MIFGATDLIGIAAIVAAFGTLLTAMAVVITAFRTNRKIETQSETTRANTRKAAAELREEGYVRDEKLEQIHILVNSRLQEALDKIDALEARLGEGKK